MPMNPGKLSPDLRVIITSSKLPKQQILCVLYILIVIYDFLSRNLIDVLLGANGLVLVNITLYSLNVQETLVRIFYVYW